MWLCWLCWVGVLGGREGTAAVCARGKGPPQPLHLHGFTWHRCTKSVCVNPDASLLLCRKQRCPRGHHVGSGVAQPLKSHLQVLAQLLVPAQSKALVQATHSRDACPGGRGHRGLCCNGNCFLNPDPRTCGLKVESR